ncbi:hypothetical protein [Nocardioides sediminis]|uniref:hypothetical protein n=1 Tax=Nocardioides sediminis TaxID=433648 RepID=UPI000D3180F8|nr:hypothetical protein [Nocardioides sediminis]
MSGWVKALVVLALVVPMTAYVAGSLVSSRSYDPSDRAPVIIQDAPASSPDPARARDRREKRRPSPRPGASPATSPGTGAQTSRGATPDGQDDVEDNDATVVTPQPRPVDDDDDDDDDGPDGDDDDDEADDGEDDDANADDDGDDD